MPEPRAMLGAIAEQIMLNPTALAEQGDTSVYGSRYRSNYFIKPNFLARLTANIRLFTPNLEYMRCMYHLTVASEIPS